MTDTIKADDIALIWKKLNDSQKFLKQKNVYQSLVALKDALEKKMSTAMLASDQRELDKNINAFQQTLFGSKIFKDTFGPVSFQDNEQSTLLNFVLQLIKVQDQDLMETVSINGATSPDQGDIEAEVEKKAQIVMDLLEKGDLSAAKQLLSRSDQVSAFVANTYNTSGITSRKKGEFDKSIGDYMKALIALPDDEGLYYNIARAQIEKGELEEAIAAIRAALKINPDFKEGNDLLKYVVQKKTEARKRFR